MREPLLIDPDIRRAETPPGWLYSDPEVFALARERVFARSWQIVADTAQVAAPGSVCPVVLLPGMLDEPLLLARDAGGSLRCLSNVCTHRANLVVEAAGSASTLLCRYHGRRFALDGRCLAMPGFEGGAGFPAPADDLPPAAAGVWRQFVFAALAPAFPLERLVAEVEALCGFLPFERAILDPARSRDYRVQANWALYCDNYLEGFHIPFVHPALARALDAGDYPTRLHPHGSVQVGVARADEDAFDLPPTSPDHGRRVAGYYFWLFPATMLNLYPWGISLNLVEPLAVDETRVRFRAYVWDASRLERGAGSGLDRVEIEDEAVVESVGRGVRSRLYRRGRYSPARETGVHHFHRLLAEHLDPDRDRA